MTTGSSGAVFFLGTRAHYQVLQQPESLFDAENGNTSTESIYQNATVATTNNYVGARNVAYCDNEANNGQKEYSCNYTVTEENETSNRIKRRPVRRQSEQILCHRDSDMRPALLNHLGGCETPKKSSRTSRMNLFTYLTSFGRRKRNLNAESIQYLKHIDNALNSCTYRDSCRCLHCQSSYFDCDEEEYNSDESEYNFEYLCADYGSAQTQDVANDAEDNDEDDEVFIDTAPGDNASTDLLLETAEEAVRDMSVSSDDEDGSEDDMDLEVAAGAPVLLNYLLMHPITCAIQ